LVELTVLPEPTYAALDTALREADKAGNPFDVLHFDGHGVYNPLNGLSGLCFEDPGDKHKLSDRNMEFVDAQKMAGLCKDYRIPIVFLEACKSAAEQDATESVAAKLLAEGVTSVLAMSHSVLVETARRFVEAFYQKLAIGARVGSAMLAGQRALYSDTHRGTVFGNVPLELHDWFVPVLYQETQDPQPITAFPSAEIQQLQSVKRKLALGQLPETPLQTFIGRSRELLAIERLLSRRC
jgi:CHAT domain-containing protein